jgi:hypothetical protein
VPWSGRAIVLPTRTSSLDFSTRFPSIRTWPLSITVWARVLLFTSRMKNKNRSIRNV